jgi:hypothetical protein
VFLGVVALKISPENKVVSTYDNSINPCVSYSQYVSLLFAQSPDNFFGLAFKISQAIS